MPTQHPWLGDAYFGHSPGVTFVALAMRAKQAFE
jgi:hypothetical protein